MIAAIYAQALLAALCCLIALATPAGCGGVVGAGDRRP
jgi:hypothetical protein